MTWESFGQWWIDLFTKIGNWFISPDESGLNYIARILLALAFILIGHYLIKLIVKLLKKAFKLTNKLEVDVSAKSFAVDFVKILLQIFLVIIVMSTLKVDMTSLAAVFSAATVAIGLSLQHLISSLASGVVLLKAKHFKTGDYIKVDHDNGTCEGEVKKVSILSTTLKTVNNQNVIIANNKLLEGVITNFSMDRSRRDVLMINIEYDQDIELARKAIMHIITSDDRILKDPAPIVHIDELGDYSIKIAVKYYTDISVFWDVHNYFYEKILQAFKDKNIKIATNKIRIESSNIEHVERQ